MAHRFHRHWGSPLFHKDRLEQPYGTRKPGLVFVCSTSDLFHDGLTDQDIHRVFGIMAADNRHTFLVLTKRIQRAAEFLIAGPHWEMGAAYANGIKCDFRVNWPIPNVWIGVTAENQQRADERIPILLSIPAALHFVSIEPMLGRMHIEPYLLSEYDKMAHEDQMIFPPGGLSRAKVDWVIAGKENGPKRRPFEDGWVNDSWDTGTGGIAAQCEEWGTPFFDKREPTDPAFTRREFPKMTTQHEGAT
jgi:protein gp37